MTSGDMH